MCISLFVFVYENKRPSPSEVLDLAMQMGLERDEVLLRQYVCNLCEVGEDAEADEAVLAVTKNTDALALSLLEIAGIRLALLMDSRVSDDALATVAKVGDFNRSACNCQAPISLRWAPTRH
jgi:hypothetical protein